MSIGYNVSGKDNVRDFGEHLPLGIHWFDLNLHLLTHLSSLLSNVREAEK
ncbi:MAG: hypothetical protein QOC96_345 [Acidobacteriota bacterium]|jgi:hypothetical protein|nr:hypothetical protein [Acidobacteriota bacterium]